MESRRTIRTNRNALMNNLRKVWKESNKSEGWTEGKTEGSRVLRPKVGMRSWRYSNVPRCTRGNGKKAVTKDAAMNEMRNDPVEDCQSHGKGTEASERTELKQSSGDLE
jgi:hypothetical protein